jgi:transposase
MIATLAAVAEIDTDMKRMARASAARRQLMTITGVSLLTVAFGTPIDDPSFIRRFQDIGAYLGLVPKRDHSAELDYASPIGYQ